VSLGDQKVAILGAGSWGSALAYVLGGKEINVALWDRDPDLVAQINALNHNPKYLPETPLGETVRATASMEEALGEASWAIVAVASNGVRSVVAEAAASLDPKTAIISAAKGLEAETGFTMADVIVDELGDTEYRGVAAISGPNLAKELARGVPSATVVASLDPAIARGAQNILMTDRTFRVYTHSDVKGVELGGALKNVLAIGAGISDGLGFGDNTKAALMSRGLIEMTQIGVACGGKALTFLGLAGVGDLLATTVSKLSRNYRVGLGLAEGKSVEQILEELHQAAEGVPTARAVQTLIKKYDLVTPIFTTIHEVLYDGKPPSEAVDELMTRAAKEEFAF
jgi:glycerol-3-phosphate dehydrogenase (NAD(P)+)